MVAQQTPTDDSAPRAPYEPADRAVVEHPHLRDPQPDPDRIRIDMHTHTMWSGDSTTTPEEFASALRAAALDVVCITDHNAVAGAQRLAEELPELLAQPPADDEPTSPRAVGCEVIVGEEVRTATGELIGLFLTERVAMGMSAADTARAIRDQGGLVYVPHPFDPMRRCLTEASLYELAEAGLLDAVEVLNSKTSLASLNARAAAFAAEFDLAAGAGSDAHVPAALGAAFVSAPRRNERTGPSERPGPSESSGVHGRSETLEWPRFDRALLLAALRAGSVHGHHWDKPRPWSARIIPSV